MGFVIFILFLTVPIIEIIGFIQIGSLIGIWATIGIVILTAIAGSLLLRYQGLSALFQAQSKLMEGKVPIDQMVDGLCLGFAGALLLTPGFFTDIFGFLLFIPPFRRGFASLIFDKVIKPRTTIFTNFPPEDSGNPHYPSSGPGDNPFDDSSGSKGPIIDADYQDVGTSENQKDRRSDDRLSSQQRRDNGDENSSDGGQSPWLSKS